MKRVLKKIFNRFFYSLGYVPAKNEKTGGIHANVFKTSHSKTALLSYIKNVFENEETRNDRSHTNRYTTFLIAEVLNELGYKVDVINYNDSSRYDLTKYALIIGLGEPLDYALQNRENTTLTKVIWFGTGCNPLYSNVATIKRLEDFHKKHQKLFFSSSRYISRDWPLQHEFADWIILHGSTFARSTYSSKNISSIHAPVFIYHSVKRTEEDWVKAKQNYLWFGTGGLIHKGLDLVIDAFKDLPDYNLHICGGLESEADFFNHYKPVLDSSTNMIYHGFTDIKSEAFEKILHTCAFVIFPSASEGNSPSVITCMANGGLIPLVPKSTDVDLNGFGVEIEMLETEAVLQSVRRSQALSVSDIKQQSERIIEETSRLNSFEYFKKDFKQKLQEALHTIQK